MSHITFNLTNHPIAEEARKAWNKNISLIHKDPHEGLDFRAQREINQQTEVVSASIHLSVINVAEGKFNEVFVHDESGWAGQLRAYGTECCKWLAANAPEKFTEIKSIIEATIQEKLQQLQKHSTPETRQMVTTIGINVCFIAFATFMQSMTKGESWTECFKLSFLSVVPGSIMSVISYMIQQLIDSQTLAKQAVKSAMVGMSMEAAENTLTTLAGALVGFTIGILWDILSVCLESRDANQTWWQYVKVILGSYHKALGSVERNAALAGASALVAYLFPALATFAISLSLPIIFRWVEEERKLKGNTSFLWTVGEAAFRKVSFIPLSVWYTLTYVPPKLTGKIYPREMLCGITNELLKDPVYVLHTGIVCSRHVAEERIKADGHLTPIHKAKLEDIFAMPLLASVIAKANLLTNI